MKFASRRAMVVLSLIVFLLVPVSVSAGLVVGANVNITRRPGNQVEAAIAINPTNPQNLFMASNNDAIPVGVFAAYSMDGGATWNALGGGAFATGADGLPGACCDPSAAFDQLGNLFIASLVVDRFNQGHTVVALSTNGGQSFTLLTQVGTDADQPTVATGPGVVWITYKEFGQAGTPIVAHGTTVSGLGM